jgi:MFS transporter, PAT family, beta-lactamase induction signal transducer AmpG
MSSHSVKPDDPIPSEPLAPGNEEAATEAIPADDGPDRGATDKSPWRFVPSLYFLQGIPVVIVQQMSVTMYKKMGIPNDQIGLWTSLIAWPWVVKMLWGPMVDNQGTKRAWIVVTQAIIVAMLGVVAFGLTQPAFFAITLAAFFGIAFVSATHDIAADGYYLLALKQKAQAAFVGIRSTFFRLAMIFGSGVLIVLAGRLELSGVEQVPGLNVIAPLLATWNVPGAWTIALAVAALVYGVFFLYNLWALPRVPRDAPQQPVDLPRVMLSFGQILLLLVGLFLIGRWFLLGAATINEAFIAMGAAQDMLFTATERLSPLFLPMYDGQAAGVEPYPFVAPVVVPFALQALVSVALIAAVAWSTNKLFERIGMKPAAREYFSQERILAVLAFILFYRFGESMLVKMAPPFLIDPPEQGGLGVVTSSVGIFVGTVGVLGLTIGGLLGGWLIAKKGLRKCLWPMILALNLPNLLYVWLAWRKPVSPLSDMIARDQVPFAHIELGKMGQPALDFLADFVVNIPSQIYNLFLLAWLALQDPVGQVITLDQLGYGFAFAAYMVYLMYLARNSERKTSHYAISTGLMALGAMIAGILSGYVQSWFAGTADQPNPLAYYSFFIVVCLAAIPGILTLFFIPLGRDEDE